MRWSALSAAFTHRLQAILEGLQFPVSFPARALLRPGAFMMLLRHAVGGILGHLLGPIALLLDAVEQLVDGTLDGFEMAELLFGAANAVGDFGDFLFKGYLGLAIALRAHCLVEAVVKFGHAAFKIAHLREVAARRAWRLLKALA